MGIFKRPFGGEADSSGDPAPRPRRITVETFVREAWERSRGTRTVPNFDPIRAVLPNPAELPDAQRKILGEVIGELWSRPQFTAQEAQEAAWAAHCLQVDGPTHNELHRTYLIRRITPHLDEWVRNDLQASPVRDTLDRYAELFRSSRDGMLRFLAWPVVGPHLVGVFDSVTRDGGLSADGWEALIGRAGRIGMTLDELRRLLRSDAERFLLARFRRAVDGGLLSPAEWGGIVWQAASLGLSAAELRRLTLTDARRYLTSRFREAVGHGTLPPGAWKTMVDQAESFGIELDELRRLIHRDVERYVAGRCRASVDPRPSSNAGYELAGEAGDLGMSTDEFQRLVRLELDRRSDEVSSDRPPAEISRDSRGPHAFTRPDRPPVGEPRQRSGGAIGGHHPGAQPSPEPFPPTIPSPPSLILNSGEVLHFYARAAWQEARRRPHGLDYTPHFGELAITDWRLIFTSLSKNCEVELTSVVRCEGDQTSLKVHVKGRPTIDFYLERPDHQAKHILETAIGVVRRTVDVGRDDRASRHISAQTRSRVWARDGGQCVQCGATEYLEFDHEIPYSRGGSSDEGNIRILCRKCNLKKGNRL